MGAAHFERSAAQRAGQNEPEAVYVGLPGDLAAIQADLLGRDIIIFACEFVADQRFAHLRGTGNAEVDDLRLLHAGVRQDDVVW